jgi:hypothetical protein
MGTDKKEKNKGIGGEAGARLSLGTTFFLSVPIRVIRGWNSLSSLLGVSVSLWFNFGS